MKTMRMMVAIMLILGGLCVSAWSTDWVVEGNLTVSNNATVYGDLIATNATLRGGPSFWGSPNNPVMLHITGGDTIIGTLAQGHGTAIGLCAFATNGSVAIGQISSAGVGSCYGAVAVGPNASADGDGVAFGASTVSSNTAVCVGSCSVGYWASTTLGHAAASSWFGVSVGFSSQAYNEGFAGGAYTKANGRGNIAIGGDVFPSWGGQAAQIDDGYQDAIQLGRNRISTNMAPALAASHYLRIWGGVADGGLELNGDQGTLSVSNLTVTGAITAPGQGDISMGSYTNRP